MTSARSSVEDKRHWPLCLVSHPIAYVRDGDEKRVGNAVRPFENVLFDDRCVRYALAAERPHLLRHGDRRLMVDQRLRNLAERRGGRREQDRDDTAGENASGM